MLLKPARLSESHKPELLPVDLNVVAEAIPPRGDLEQASFLISLPDDELLVVPSSDAHFLPRDQDGEVLRKHASALAASWRRERYRAARRVRMPDWLMVYVDELHAASTREDVVHALVACAPLLVGGYTAVVFLRAGESNEMPLRPLQEPNGHVTLPPLPPAAATAFSGPCVVTDVEVRGDGGGAYAFLSPVLDAFGAAQLVCAPVAPGVLLVIIERRRDRVCTGEDLDLLQWIVKHAMRCLGEMTFRGTDIHGTD